MDMDARYWPSKNYAGDAFDNTEIFTNSMSTISNIKTTWRSTL